MTRAMKKRMLIMLASMGILFGLIFGFQAFKAVMIKKFMAANSDPVITVSAMKTTYQPWQPQLKASGSLRAVQGVEVTSEVAGQVRTIQFMPGAAVKAGDLLVELNADADIAQLHALQATADLAATIYKRDQAQLAAQAISKAALDTDAADLKSKEAQVDEQVAVVAKKAIRAPFAGRLGISAANPGQYVSPGDKIVTLQALDPIYADFYVPQQALVTIATNQAINLTTDTYPGQTFSGKITTINPKVDPATRNVQVEATLANPKNQLLPGMFGTVVVDTGTPQRYLTLPQSAVSFNPYGEIVYIVKPKGPNSQGKPLLLANQVFVTVGDTRGDQIAILSGVKEGDLVVTSGQVKLKNGSPVNINNSVVPDNNPSPKPVDE